MAEHNRGTPTALIIERDAPDNLSSEEGDARWEASERLIGALRDAAVVIDSSDQRIVCVNLAAEELLGQGASLRGEPLPSLLADAEQLPGALQRLDAALESRKLVWLSSLRLITCDSQALSVSGTVLPVVDRSLRGWMLVVHPDSLGGERIERALARRMELAAQLSADAAHKLRNLSTATLSALGQLRFDLDAAGEEAEATLRTFEEASRQYEQLVERFLEFCRGHPAGAHGVDVCETLGGVADLLARTLPASVTLVAKRDDWPGGLSANADPELVRQMILAIAAALRRALLKGGEISIQVESCDERERLEGAGSRTRGCRILVRGRPLETSTSEIEAALQVEAELVAQIAGRLEVCGDEEQHAIEIALQLPLAGDTGEHASVAVYGRGERVLLVARESYAVRIVLATLRSLGCIAALVTSPAELQRALSMAPRAELVILDDSASPIFAYLELLAADQRSLMIGSEEREGAAARTTMALRRPFQLTDLRRCVAELLGRE